MAKIKVQGHVAPSNYYGASSKRFCVSYKVKGEQRYRELSSGSGLWMWVDGEFIDGRVEHAHPRGYYWLDDEGKLPDTFLEVGQLVQFEREED